VTDSVWTSVDEYFEGALLPPDASLEAALVASRDAGLPAISVSPLQGRLLQILARSAGAARILEVGTLGGYSTIWLARALPPGGHLITLEINTHHAETARDNLLRAGVGDRVEIRVGPAAESLAALGAEGAGPFDLVFIDADKRSNVTYLEWALRLTRPGSVIVVDNVVRSGAVVDAASADSDIIGVRRLMDAMGADARIEATAVQTVGTKGYDGFAIGLVTQAPADDPLAASSPAG
jgi:predicted O-methyltransferase YrrM